MRARRLPLALIAAVVCSLASAGAAAASESSNWAGYAVHRFGVHFADATATWTVPHASCVAGHPTYSSTWVGIGGYSTRSSALEQVGTELDCTAAGRAVSSAWYELVPSPSRGVHLRVTPGDRVRAAVSVTGHEVTLRLADLTTGRTFTRRLDASSVDDSSAEWILEAPSVCTDGAGCRTLPLADFGSTEIAGARVTTSTGRTASIADRRWVTSRIDLVQRGRRFVDAAGSDVVRAVTSALSHGAFRVSYDGGVATVDASRG